MGTLELLVKDTLILRPVECARLITVAVRGPALLGALLELVHDACAGLVYRI